MTARYDLELFRALNDEYAEKRLVPAPRQASAKPLHEQATRRAAWLDRRIGLRGRRVLEIGAGRGHFCAVLAADYGCEVIGVDITEYDTWGDFDARCDLRVVDITTEDLDQLGTFDRIVSFAVFEHVERPYEGLAAMHELLRPDGRAYMSANLYRGPKASHRYRQVYFPFPHLLFDDDVFAEFYASTKHDHRAAAWVNKLTAAQYREKVRELGFEIVEQWLDTTPLDRDFYERFDDVLGRYPVEDLETDFLHLVLDKHSAENRTHRWIPPAALDLEKECRRLAGGAKRRLSRAVRRLRKAVQSE